MRSFIFSLGLLLSAASFGQIATAHEFCKTKDVELMTDDYFPDCYIIIGIRSISRTEGLDAISKLSPKEFKSIQKRARFYQSCLAFIDFKNVVPDANKREGYISVYFLLKKMVLEVPEK